MFAPNVLAACAGKSITQPTKKPPPAARLTFRPADATTDVVPIAPTSVEVSDGWLQHVALTNSAGKVVAGSFNQDRTVYTTTEPLGYDSTYTWRGSAVGHDGKAMPVAGKFTTVSPTKKIGGAFQLADGQTVGVAAPIIIQFDASISDKAAVERALNVTTDPPVEGSWAWLPDERQGARVHWRSKEYYPAGTTVNVDAKLYGVPFGDGAFGDQDISLHFQIGRRQVVKAEVTSHRIQVVTDAGVIMDFPCSYGEADKARNVTRNGIHVVTEKYADFYMSNPAAGYSNVHERWAVRISNNGEFIHANPMSAGAQGNTNVTNGCINLSTADAAEYYAQRDLRRPGRGDRQLDPAVLLRRRHLGLGRGLGHLGVDVGAAGSDGAPAVDADPGHRAGHAVDRAQLVGHADDVARPRQRRSWRLNRRLADAWSRGRMMIWSRLTCEGREATNPITSATSAATSGVMPV